MRKGLGSMSTQIVDPRAPRTSAERTAPPPVSELSRAGIVVIDNSKPNFDRFAGRIVEGVQALRGSRAVHVIRKESPSVGVSEPELYGLLPEFGVVLAGSGD